MKASVILQFIFSHASTILLCVVLMWLVFNWREAVASAKTFETMLTTSDNWHAKWNESVDRQRELDLTMVKLLSETTDNLRLEANQLHEDLRKSRSDNELINDWNQRLADENQDLRNELYALRRSLWIERNGPPGENDVFF